MTWKPWLGAVPDARGTHFRVWAPKADSLSVRVLDGPTVSLQREADGYFAGRAAGVQAGARYFYRFPDGRQRPDPASPLQPEGVHGPSEVVDLGAVAPKSPRSRVPLRELVFNEIHLGTYTVEGTADAAHAAGLSAFLDVVYNHLGPEGNYLGEYGPYFTAKHKTPWGDAIDFSLGPVRRHFVENALRWVSRAGAGFDGLRLDAVHGIYGDSPRHILEEIADAVHAEGALVIAESDLNDPKLIEQYHLDGSWADDLHHALHVALTGESQGYYADFRDPLPKLAAAIERGWFYEGQYKPSFKRPHGTPAAHLRPRHFVVCAQNHDQIGNRASGERLTTLTDEGGVRAAAAVVALQPALPLYFQGEEWGAREPFQYFISHTDPALVEAVRKGRREEFKDFTWTDVPDPFAEETFRASRIDRGRKDERALQWHKALLKLRREHPALQDDSRKSVRASAQGKVLLMQRGAVLVAAAFDAQPSEARLPPGRWRVLLGSGAAQPGEERLRFRGRGAAVLEQG